MGKLSAHLVGDSIFVTRFESSGHVIPNNISQEERVVAIIDNSIDTDVDIKVLEPEYKAVPRRDFLIKLLTSVEGSDAKYSVYAKGLYSAEDMHKGITWCEVAYLLYYVGGINHVLDWRNITPEPKYNVCVLQEVVVDKKVINEKLAMYKSRLDMESYIGSLIGGKRYIPLPLYCAYIDLVANDELGLKLSTEHMFKKVSEKDLSCVFGG